MELEDIQKMLLINKHRLDDEFEVQADVQWIISEKVSSANARKDDAKNKLDEVEAELSSDFSEDDPKLSLAKIQAKVIVHSSRIKAFQNFQACKKDYERWWGMLDAWRSKGFSLSNMAELYKTNYFTMDSDRVTTSKSSNYETTKEYKDGREALTKARRQVQESTSIKEETNKIKRRTVMD